MKSRTLLHEKRPLSGLKAQRVQQTLSELSQDDRNLTDEFRSSSNQKRPPHHGWGSKPRGSTPAEQVGEVHDQLRVELKEAVANVSWPRWTSSDIYYIFFNLSKFMFFE